MCQLILGTVYRNSKVGRVIMSNFIALPDYDGTTAYKGALRFYNHSDKTWETQWGSFYGDMKPSFQLFASDAFGTAYGYLESKEVAIFWPETAELESIGTGARASMK